MKQRSIISLITLLLCAIPPTYAAQLPERIDAIQHRTAQCFVPPPTVNCEISAAVQVGKQLLLANDKPVPAGGGASIFTLNFNNSKISGQPAYLPGDILKQAQKFEALTKTLDGNYVIASTAFNRVGTEQDPRADAFNAIAYWPVNNPGAAKLLAPSSRGGIDSSLAVREQIRNAIGWDFFQVEGLTIAPSEPGLKGSADGQLMLGIRRQGASYETSQFGFKIVSAPIKLNDGNMELVDSFKPILAFDPNKPEPTLGLSGIEYDRFNKDRLYALTSFETESVDGNGNEVISIGGFLWVVPFTEGKLGTPRLVSRKDGSALRFSNKPEGIEVLDANRILVIHDDDRVEVETSEAGVKRGNSEFAYSVITFPHSNRDK